MSIKKPDGIQIELDSTKIVDVISKSIIREEEKKNEKKLRNFAILATGNVRASRYIKEPKINMSKLFSGIFTSICFCNFLQDYNERNISVTYIPTTDYEKTIVVTADFVDTTIFGMPVTVKRSTQFGLFYDYFQYDLNIEELYHEYERLTQLISFCKVYKCTLEDLMPAETISYVSSLAGMDTEMLKSMMNVFRKTVGLKTA